MQPKCECCGKFVSTSGKGNLHLIPRDAEECDGYVCRACEEQGTKFQERPFVEVIRDGSLPYSIWRWVKEVEVIQ